ncbi:MAG: thermonuclease family protein [Methylovirgula sp.]
MAAIFNQQPRKGHSIIRQLLGLATFLALTPASATSAAPAAAPAATSTCPTAGTQSAKVAKVDERLDIILQDGRSLHLAGLDPPQPTPDAPDFPARASDALAAMVGGGISFLPLAPTPDRWGRIPAFVFLPPRTQGAPPEAAADFLLAQGFARFMPTQEAHPCRAAFLAAEEKARRAKLGLWRDPYYAIIEATNRAAFADKAATNVIVQGRLVDVTSTGVRTSLQFAPRRDRGFSVTILQRNVAIFDRSGLDFRALIGRILRVRGLLDLRFGPHIEISSDDDIELITDGQKQGGTARQSETNAAPPPAKDP